MTDIVYIWSSAPAQWEELRYSIRSVERFFGLPYRIVVVGDRPAWLKNAACIRVPQLIRKENQKHIDQAWKIMSYLYEHRKGPDFILIHDDVVFLKRVTPLILHGPYAYGTRDEFPYRSDFYIQLVQHTMSLFEPWGEPWCYETHMPQVFNRKILYDVMLEWQAVQEGRIIATMYHNHTHRHHLREYRPELYLEHHQNFFGRDTPHSASSDDQQWIRQKLRGKMSMSYNNTGLTPEMKLFLQEMFPNPSKHEL